MLKLTTRQIQLLQAHRIKPAEVLDARGWKRKERLAAFETEKYLVALHGRPECKFGHTEDLWSTSGHCIVCRPENVQHQKMYRERGYVYIVHSKAAKVIKVGSTTKDDIQTRIMHLNSHAYANSRDWRLVEHYYVEKCGRVEDDLRKALSSFEIKIEYAKAEKSRISSEVFSCSPTKARKELDALF